MAIYIQYKFHEIPSVGYLVMAEVRKWDGRKDRWKDGQRQPNFPPPLAGDNKQKTRIVFFLQKTPPKNNRCLPSPPHFGVTKIQMSVNAISN